MSNTRRARESKPSFIVRPRRQFVDEGGTAKFKTSFDGEPTPSVKWMKDRIELRDGNKYKIYEKNSFYFLEVMSVSPDDNGDYACIISNHLGKAEVTAELEVFGKPKPRALTTLTSRVAPSFEKELSDSVATEGTTLKLECTVKGHPKPFIQWYFNGKMLRRSHGAKESFEDDIASLTIEDVTAKHAGKYECMASNSLGEVKTACRITMKGEKAEESAPQKSVEDKETVKSSRKESLHLGEEKVTSSIEKESYMERITRRRGYGLKSYDIGTKDTSAAEMETIVQNSHKSIGKEVRPSEKDVDSDKATETKQEPPTEEGEPQLEEEEIEAEEEEIEVEEEELEAEDEEAQVEEEEPQVENEELEAEEEEEEPQVEEEEPEPEEEGLQAEGEELELEETQLEEAELEEEANSFDQELVAAEEEEEIAEQEEELETEELYDEELLDGEEEQAIEDEEALNAMEGQYDTEEGPLDEEEDQRSDVDEDHSDLSDVQAGTTAEPEGRVLSVSRPLQNKNVKEGQAVVLECEIAGISSAAQDESNLTIHWLRNGELLVPSGGLQMQHSGDAVWLSVAETLVEHGGEYMCIIQHGTVKVWTSCILTVQESVAMRESGKDAKTAGEPPSFVKKLQNLEVKDGDRVELEVKVKGDKPMEVCWLHGSEEIKQNDKVYQLVTEDDTHKLIIRDAFPEDSGNYICEVYNKYGDDETSCVLTVKEPHGEGTSLFSKLSRRKQELETGITARTQSSELTAVHEERQQNSSREAVEHDEPKRLHESAFARAKKTLGSEVSKAVRADNVPHISSESKVGSRFAKSKQVFEAQNVITEERKKVNVPVRKLKEKFEVTEIKKKTTQPPVEYQWKKSSVVKTTKTIEDKVNRLDQPLETRQQVRTGTVDTEKEAVLTAKHLPLISNQSSAPEFLTSSQSSQAAVTEPFPTSTGQPHFGGTSSANTRQSLYGYSPSIERVVPSIRKHQPATIKVANVTSPTHSGSAQFPPVEFILPAESLLAGSGNQRISGSFAVEQRPNEPLPVVQTAVRSEDEQKRFVSSVTFGSIGPATPQAGFSQHGIVSPQADVSLPQAGVSPQQTGVSFHQTDASLPQTSSSLSKTGVPLHQIGVTGIPQHTGVLKQEHTSPQPGLSQHVGTPYHLGASQQAVVQPQIHVSSPHVGISPKHVGVSQPVGVSSETYTTPQTGVSPQIGVSPQTSRIHQISVSPQTGVLPQTSVSPQPGRIHQTGILPQTGVSPQTGISPQTSISPQSGRLYQASVSPQTGISPQTGRIHQASVLSQTGVYQQTDILHQTGVSPQSGRLHQTSASPQTGVFQQTGISPHVGVSHEGVSHEIGASHYRGASSEGASHRFVTSPNIGVTQQGTASPHTGVPHHTGISPQAVVQQQVRASPYIGLSQEAVISPQSTVQSPPVSNIVPVYSPSSQQMAQHQTGHGMYVRPEAASQDSTSPVLTGGYPEQSRSVGEEVARNEVSSVVINTKSPAPAFKAIDFTIDLKSNQVITVTPEVDDQSAGDRSGFSLVDSQGVAIVQQPIRIVDPSDNQSASVGSRPSGQLGPGNVIVGSPLIITQENVHSNQPISTGREMASVHSTRPVITSIQAGLPGATHELYRNREQNNNNNNNNNDIKASTFAEKITKFETSQHEGAPKIQVEAQEPRLSWKPAASVKNVPSDSNQPTFVRRPKSLNVDEGSSAVFTAEVRGQPTPSIQWQRNGTVLSEGDKYKFSQTGETHTFEISHVLLSDAGRYTCFISNVAGTEKSSVSLVVKQAESTEVTDFRGLLKTRSQTKKFDMQGNYDKNLVGKQSGGEQKDFRGVLRRHSTSFVQPKFLTTLVDTQVNEGDKVVFQVKVTGVPPPKITWCHGNTELRGSQCYKIDYSPSTGLAELTLAEAFTGNAGVYHCKAENGAGYAESSCSLQVRGQVRERAQDTSLSAVSATAFKEKLDQSKEPFMSRDRTSSTEVVHTLDQSLMANSGGVSSKIHTDGCASTGTSESVTSDDLFAAPRLKSECPSSGCSTETLDSIKVTPEEGRMTSTAGSVISDSEASRLTHEEPPMIVNLLPQSLNVLKGEDIKLSGSFIGIPQPTVKWFVEECRTSTEILPDNRISITTTANSSVLHIKDAAENDTGIYTLEISNHLGFNHLSSSVTVEEDPSVINLKGSAETSVSNTPDPPVTQPFISNITNNSLILSWYGASYDGGSPILCYMVEMKKEHEDKWTVLNDTIKHTSYAVTNLKPNEGYEFRVSAGNRHGFGRPSKTSDVVYTMEREMADAEEPRSPDVLLTDELPFDPRHVEVKKDQKFEDNYYLGEQIGRGKFGCVYKCLDKVTGRQFAAKFIKAARITQKTDVKQEINVMNELHHPKLLLLWDAYESKREIILVMEHIGGGELLSRVVDEDYILTERECVHFMRQICDGVRFIHKQNIVHLDLKPENIMCITKNSNEIKIIDFGLARKLDLTKSNKVMFGTAEFVAPEVVNYDSIDFGTDMWSVGVICYILLSGLSPFAGETDAETLSNVTMAQYDFDEEEFEEITDDAKDFIVRLLQKDLRKRMSARDCLQHKWLAQDVKYMKAKRLSTEKHKRFLNRMKWRKAKYAVEMINRMQKVMGSGNISRSYSRSSTSSSQGRSINGSSTPSQIESDFVDSADLNTNNNNRKNDDGGVFTFYNGD